MESEDSSVSSDSENSRDLNRGKQQIRILESNLNAVKQQIRMAKTEIRKCTMNIDKEMYCQLKHTKVMGEEGKNMSEGDETDRSSEFSCGSLSSRSMGLDTSLEGGAVSRENSSTPKMKNNKM
jgi:hypothetical protein